jgi:hypothetical protein
MIRRDLIRIGCGCTIFATTPDKISQILIKILEKFRFVYLEQKAAPDQTLNHPLSACELIVDAKKAGGAPPPPARSLFQPRRVASY